MSSVIVSLGEVLLLLLSVAFFTLLERNVMASVQIRSGPNKVSMIGILQPFADGLNLFRNEQEVPLRSVSWVYLISPGLSFFLSLLVWAVNPTEWGAQTWSSSLVILGLYLSLSVFGVITVGWFSNSKFASIGAVRGVCQSISYEIGLSFAILFLSVASSSLSLEVFPYLQEEVALALPFLPVFVCVCVLFLSESGRSPFDLSEGESELVSGYSVEYGGIGYTLVFLSENLALLWISWILSWIFLFPLSPLFIFTLSVFLRVSYPRLRFDNMMGLFWFSILPLTIGVSGVFVTMIFS